MKDKPMLRPLPSISPSSVADLDCIKKFHTLRVLGEWPETNKSFGTVMLFGLGVHAVLKNLYSPSNPVRPDIKNLDIYARQAFYNLRYMDIADRDEDLERCKRIVLKYIEQDDIEDADNTIAVERSGDILIERNEKPGFFLTAKLDRVIRRNETIVVRDYKFGKPRLNLHEAFIQLWLAKLTYPEYRSFVAEYDWIDSNGRVERDSITPDRFKGIYRQLIDKINLVLDSIDEGDYPAQPGESCTYCPLKRECQPTPTRDITTALDLVFDKEVGVEH